MTVKQVWPVLICRVVAAVSDHFVTTNGGLTGMFQLKVSSVLCVHISYILGEIYENHCDSSGFFPQNHALSLTPWRPHGI